MSKNKSPQLDIIKALKDPLLLGQFIKDSKTWRTWRVFHRAFFGLKPARGDSKILKACTDLEKWPSKPSSEAWLIVGRRGGKSFTVALIAAYLAAFREYPVLAAGELGHIIIVSPTKLQSGVIKRYLGGFFSQNAFLKSLVVRETQSEIELSSGVSILVLTSDFRSLRGYTAIAAIVDEIAFFYSEGSRPCHEAIRALRPALATTGGPLIAISTPYARRGILYDMWKGHYGKESDVLVWSAPSSTMNPSLDQRVIDKALEEDFEAAQVEWLIDPTKPFRADIETYLHRAAYEAVVVKDRFELRPVGGFRYTAFVDPSGGSSDSMTLAICHQENDKRILDCIREAKPPFSPESVVADFARTCRKYGISSVTGDRYAGLWPRERFEIHGIRYIVSKKSKSELYLDFLPLINSGEVELLENKKLKEQFLNLERRTGKTGKDVVDHPVRGKDDVANAVAGVIVGTHIRRAGTTRPQRSRRRLSTRRMCPNAVSIHTFDRESGEIIKIA